MTSPIILNQFIHPAHAISETLKIPQITSSISFGLGENLDAFVLRYTPDNKVVLKIKDVAVAADSQVSLGIGEKLTVRVDQTLPNVILRIVDRKDTEILPLNDLLKWFRSQPTALKEQLTALQDLFIMEHSEVLSQFISKKDIQALYKALDQIIISKPNLANPLFLKDYIVSLGLILERKLLKALSDPAQLKDGESNPSLKEILLRLSSEFQTVQNSRDFSDLEIQQKMKMLSHMVDRTLKCIESFQAVNVLAQEQDQLFLLQIPFQFPDGIRMQDVYIEADQGTTKQSAGRQYRITLFLDMDALGELAVDAGAGKNSLRCTIKCQKQDICNYISSFLPELQGKLADMGYETVHIQCVLDKNLSSWKQDFLCDHHLFSLNMINVSV